MNGWQRLWNKLWGTQRRRLAAANKPAWPLALVPRWPHWSAVPEEWVLASLIRG
jgi:hypothetical protein